MLADARIAIDRRLGAYDGVVADHQRRLPAFVPACQHGRLFDPAILPKL
jgi:hypothetical protein